MPRTSYLFCIPVALAVAAAGGNARAQGTLQVSEPFATDAAVPWQYNLLGWDLAMATDGQNILTVFEDAGVIRGMLVNENGKGLAPRMLELDDRFPDVSYHSPSVTFGDDRYLVGWWRDDGIVAVQAVARDGLRLGDPLVLAQDAYYPHAVWTGTAFLAVWYGTGDARNLYAALVDDNGGVVQRGAITDTGDVTEPALAVGSSTILVTWFANPESASTGVFGTLLDLNGTPISSTPFHISVDDTGYDIRVVYDGTRYFVLWRDGYTLVGRQVSESGTLGDEIPIASAESLGNPVLGFDGEKYLVVYKDYNGSAEDLLLATHISRSGVVDSAATVITSLPTSSATPPELLWTGSRYWATYNEDGVFGRFLDADLAPLGDPAPLSLMPCPQDNATVIWNGEHYVLVWTDQRDGEYLYSGHAVRVSRAGQILDPGAVHITDDTNRPSWMVAASAGNGLTVTGWGFADTDAAALAVIRPDGTLGGVTPLTDIPTSSVSLASDGEGFLAMLGEQVETATGYAAYGQLLDGNGTPVGAPFILREQESFLTATVHEAARGYLFRYRDTDTYLQPVSSTGEPGEPFLLQTGGVVLYTATNGSETLVVWHDSVDVVHGRFYANGGWAGNPFAIASTGSIGDVVWDGTAFVAVWYDEENQAWLRYIQPDGAMPEDPILLFNGEMCTGPALGSDGEGQLLLSCVRYQDHFRTRRLVNYIIGELRGEVVDPEDTDPQDTDPEGTDPEGTDPGTTDPTATDPVNTDPSTTDPEGTDPGTTDPTATDPTATDPDDTDSGNTDPTTTVPQGTDPGAIGEADTDTDTDSGEWFDIQYPKTDEPEKSGKGSGCSVTPGAPRGNTGLLPLLLLLGALWRVARSRKT